MAATQKRPLDVTPWLSWFLGCLLRAVQGADATLAGVLEGLESKLTNAEWAALGNCSADTARRDINDLLARDGVRVVCQIGR